MAVKFALDRLSKCHHLDRDLRGLRAFVERTKGVRAGVLAYDGTEAVDLGDRLYAIPLGALLS